MHNEEQWLLSGANHPELFFLFPSGAGAPFFLLLIEIRRAMITVHGHGVRNEVLAADDTQEAG